MYKSEKSRKRDVRMQCGRGSKPTSNVMSYGIARTFMRKRKSLAKWGMLKIKKLGDL